MNIRSAIYLLAHSSNPEDKREWAVLYWKSQGLKHEEIAEKWGYSVKWVQRYMTSAYKRFEVSPELNKYEKLLYLEQNVFPLIREFIADEPDTIKELPPPPTESVPPEEPEQTGSSPIGVTPIENKEKKKEGKEPPIIEILPPKQLPPPRDKWKTFRRVFFTVVSLLIVSGVGYFAYFKGRGDRPAPQIVVVTATFPPATDTPLPTATSAIPTDTPIPTSTATQIPTTTPIPTEFVPPADGILFQDTFDQTTSSEWTVISGTWIVTNGKLTKLPYTGPGWTYEWIALKKPEWKNFLLSLDITRPEINSPDPMAFVVGQSGSQQLGIEIDSLSYLHWAFIGESWSETESITGSREDQVGLVFNLQIEVNHDTYTVRVNDREIKVMTLSGYSSREIKIGIDCDGSTKGCATIDNVKVTYLP